MDSKLFLPGIGVGVIVLLGGWYFLSAPGAMPKQAAQVPVQQAQGPKEVTHNLSLQARKMTPDIVAVTEGDQVTVKVMSDESGEFHISGYEIENDMTAGTELSFSFTADKAGRYNFELHPKAPEGEGHDEEPQASLWVPVAEASETEKGAEEEDIVIGAFVVNPR